VWQLTERHTGVHIADTLKEFLQYWGLEGKVHAFVHDNAANAVKVSEEGDFPFYTCDAHMLQLVINNTHRCQRALINATTVARRLVGHYKHSTVAVAHLNTSMFKCNFV
jgi:hypothetical protein